MRDFSKVSPSVWRSKKYRSLGSMEAQHVYLYLLTCPHGNSAGCFDLHPMYACADLGMTEIQYLDCIERLCLAGLIEWDAGENTVLIVNWLEFNAPANAKHAIGILSQLGQASSEKLKAKVFHEIRADVITRKFDREAFVRNAIEVFSKLYGDGIPTETETRPETERETETRPDQTKTETREKPRAALRTVCAEGRDGLAPSAKGRPPPTADPSRLLETKILRGTA